MQRKIKECLKILVTLSVAGNLSKSFVHFELCKNPKQQIITCIKSHLKRKIKDLKLGFKTAHFHHDVNASNAIFVMENHG